MVLNKGYVPKFNRAFEHFLLHTGGRAVIDEMEEKLSLTPKQVPSLAPLRAVHKIPLRKGFCMSGGGTQRSL